MNDLPPTLDDLISRHFDEALPSADHQRLADALAVDPEVLRDFTATARLHAGLEALAPPRARAKKRHLARWLLAGGAAAALAVGGGLFFPRSDTALRVQITLDDSGLPSADTSEIHKAKGLSRRTVKAPATVSINALQPETMLDFLAKYYVNVSPHGLAVGPALARLEAAIKFENTLQRRELDQLHFVSSASRVPELLDPVVFWDQSLPMSVGEYLRVCSLYRRVSEARMDQMQWMQPYAQLSHALHQQQPPSDSGIKEFKVPADFLSSVAGERSYPEGNAAAAKLSRSFGIVLSDGESATFSSNPATLTVAAAPTKIERLERRMNQSLLAKGLAHLIFVTTKHIKLPVEKLPVNFDPESGMILSGGKEKEFFEALAKEADVGIVTAPSIILRAGQKSEIAVQKEIFLPGGRNENVGLRQPLSANLAGELIQLEGMVDFGVFEGVGMPGDFSKLGLQTKGLTYPRHYQTEYELWLPDQSTGLFVADSPQADGMVTLVCMTATLVDPAGESVVGPGKKEIPEGIRVDGPMRAFFSPFARNQAALSPDDDLVNGSILQCPYTGKNFRIPGGVE